MAIKKKLFNTNITINGTSINTPLFPLLQKSIYLNLDNNKETNYNSKKIIKENKRMKMENKIIKKRAKRLQILLKEREILIKTQKLEKIIKDYIELNKLFFFFDVNKELQKDFKEMFFETKEKDLKLRKRDIEMIKNILEKNEEKKNILRISS